MDKFLDAYDLLKLNQEEMKGLNISLISDETESAIKSPSMRTTTG
jgi:hypothetical protein